MFYSFGTPKRLDDLGVTLPPIKELKSKYEIAIIDDEPFVRASAIRHHGFRIIELGGDIKSVSQVAEYPIIVCDIKGVAKAFGSKYEGAHLISEIRKAYPDKYLIAYTGSTFDPTYNEKLNYADKVASKDIPSDNWTAYLEEALKNVGDPKERWLRLRDSFLKCGVDLYDVFKLEQAFINSINKRDSAIFTNSANSLSLKDDTKKLITNFTATALVKLLENYIGN